MKVLMTADTVGGVWTYTLELARTLSTHGVQVAIATMGPLPTVSQQGDAATIPGLRLFTSEYKLEWMDSPWRDVERAGRWLLELEESFQPDVVHLNGYAHGVLPWHAPTLMAAHSCVLSWWLAVKGEEAPDAVRYTYGEKVRAGISATDYVVSPTLAMSNSVTHHYGRTDRMQMIPNGRHPDLFYSLEKKEPLIVSCGRLWDAAKNVIALDRIAKELPWPVCLIGSDAPLDGTTPSHAQACCACGQLSPEALARFLARSAIFCLPARYEPFGLSILEAALSECALVLGDIPSLRENWDGAALFVDPNSDSSLAQALTELIKRPKLRMENATKAKRRALQFSATRMASSYLKLYGELSSRGAETVQDRVSTCA